MKIFCFIVFTTIQFFKSGESFYVPKTVKITQLAVPRYPKTGDDVVLKCKFRLGGRRHRLYTVNWWRGSDQFFTFRNTKLHSKNVFKFDGINLLVENSTSNTVVLERVSEATSGLYRCEVMGEGPAFRTAVATARMDVIVPPKKILISHWVEKSPQNEYQIDDVVALTCSVLCVKPSPKSIVWSINNIEARVTEMRRYKDSVDEQTGSVNASSAVKFLAARYFINKRAAVSCVIEVRGHIFSNEEVLHLKQSAAYDLYSSIAWKNSLCWSILVSVLLFIHNNLWLT